MRTASGARIPSAHASWEPPRTWKVDPDTLYFVLGELPFVTALYEKSPA